MMLLAAAIVLAAAAAVLGLLHDYAAGLVLLALAVAIACTALRHHLRKEPRR